MISMRHHWTTAAVHSGCSSLPAHRVTPMSQATRDLSLHHLSFTLSVCIRASVCWCMFVVFVFAFGVRRRQRRQRTTDGARPLQCDLIAINIFSVINCSVLNVRVCLCVAARQTSSPSTKRITRTCPPPPTSPDHPAQNTQQPDEVRFVRECVCFIVRVKAGFRERKPCRRTVLTYCAVHMCV